MKQFLIHKTDCRKLTVKYVVCISLCQFCMCTNTSKDTVRYSLAGLYLDVFSQEKLSSIAFSSFESRLRCSYALFSSSFSFSSSSSSLVLFFCCSRLSTENLCIASVFVLLLVIWAAWFAFDLCRPWSHIRETTLNGWGRGNRERSSLLRISSALWDITVASVAGGSRLGWRSRGQLGVFRFAGSLFSSVHQNVWALISRPAVWVIIWAVDVNVFYNEVNRVSGNYAVVKRICCW